MKMQFLSIVTLVALLTIFSCETAEDGYVYDDWDMDNDEMLGDDEIYTAYDDIGYYEGYDTDGDGFIDEAEWNTGIGTYYNDRDIEEFGLFSDWDLNDDDRLEEDEFNQGYYTVWDTDGDGFVEATEYEEWYYDI